MFSSFLLAIKSILIAQESWKSSRMSLFIPTLSARSKLRFRAKSVVPADNQISFRVVRAKLHGYINLLQEVFLEWSNDTRMYPTKESLSSVVYRPEPEQFFVRLSINRNHIRSIVYSIEISCPKMERSLMNHVNYKP